MITREDLTDIKMSKSGSHNFLEVIDDATDVSVVADDLLGEDVHTVMITFVAPADEVCSHWIKARLDQVRAIEAYGKDLGYAGDSQILFDTDDNVVVIMAVLGGLSAVDANELTGISEPEAKLSELSPQAQAVALNFYASIQD